MDLRNLLMGHAAKRGTDKIRGFLEIERQVDLIQLLVSREIALEPAHDVRLLRLGEAGPAVVDYDRNYLALSRQEEVEHQIVQFPDKWFALLPASSLGKLRFLIHDQTYVTVCVRLVLPIRMANFQLLLLPQKVMQLDLLGHKQSLRLDLTTCCKFSDALSGVEEFKLASILKVIIRESHRTLERFFSDVIQVEAIQVPLTVLGEEVEFRIIRSF